jgi:NADH-quinone oxidoreductase subunit G
MADKPNLVTITVNDRKLTVPAGQLLIEACRDANIEIPSFCYYPNLSLQAACRMCLVEIEKMPKLATACTVQVSDGMVIRTETDKVRSARKSSLEFIFTNHPLDCPVCDAGGECELQDMNFKYGTPESRYIEPKRHRDEQQWSPVVFYDRPRCILCYRCVRVCGEGMDVWALGVSNRGINSGIIPNKGDHLECEECGQCIDICPVGALTSGAYRYKTRPWEMKHVGSICTFCGDGCKTTLGVRNDEIIRADNRDRSGINNDFLCAKGRYGVDFTRHGDRLKQPLARIDGKLRPVSWSYALQTVAKKFAEIKNAGGSFGVVGSTHSSNEENYSLQKFARSVLGTNNIDHHRTADYPSFFHAVREKDASTLAEANVLKTARAMLLVGGDLTHEHPFLAWNVRWGYRLSKSRVYILNSRAIKLSRQAFRTAVVPAGKMGDALRFLNGEGDAVPAGLAGVGPASVKRWPQTPVSTPEDIQETLQDFRARLRQEEDVVIVFSADVHGELVDQLVEFGSTLPGTTRYICLGDRANSRGAADMGLYPDLLPGYQPVTDADARRHFESAWGAPVPSQPGLNLAQMVDEFAHHKLDALYVMGANPFRRYTVAADGEPRGFLVVQDLFLTETAEQADIVLPALSAYEKDGTVTNTCGEVQLLRKGGYCEGAKTDLEVLHGLATLMGREWGKADSDRVFNEIRAQVKGYAVSLVQIMAGRGVLAHPVHGAVRIKQPSDLIQPNHDSVFTAGTLGRYSAMLNSVLEKHLTGDPRLPNYPGLPETGGLPDAAVAAVEKGQN